MRAIIWKEIRENLKWAALLLLAMAGAVAFVLFQLSPYDGRSNSLLTDEFQVVTVFGAAAAALLLGLLQTVPEIWRGQWAFLFHRPITPTRLFLGKVITGLGLYAVVMFLPLIAAAVWAATPGHIAAPFDWRMILPGIADISAGTAFYFAAMLLGIRQARWYGSRALPLALAVVCATLVVTVWEFWQAMLVVAVCVSVLMVAAWGSFVASGQYRSQPRVAKAALGTVLLVGVLGVGGFLAATVATLWQEERPTTWTNYYVDTEGRVLRIGVQFPGMMAESVSDLAGNPLDKYKDKRVYELQPSPLLRFAGLHMDAGISRQYALGGTYRRAARFYLPLGINQRHHWYFVHSEHLVVGYDPSTRYRIGAIGPAGFSPLGRVVERRFPDEEVNSFGEVLAFPSAVYRIELNARQAKEVFKSADSETVLGADYIERDVNWQPTGPIGVATSEGIHLFGADGKAMMSFPYHYPLADYPYIEGAAMPDGGCAVWYKPSPFSFDASRQPEHVVILSSTGKELNHHELPPIDYSVPGPSATQALWALIVPLALPIAWIAAWFVWAGFGDVAVAARLSELRQEMTGTPAGFLILVIVLLLVGAALWALSVRWLARRYAFSHRQRRGWTVGGFLLGPAGLLTLLVLRDWPARVSCAACGKKRIVDREVCEHCDAAFPPAPATGTEIFDES